VVSSRQWLIEVAQQEICEHGVTGVSMRSIAARANVDPSLIRHYFGSKDHLLTQAMNVSFDTEGLVADALRGTPTAVGRRTVKLVLGLCEEGPTASRARVCFAAPLSAPEAASPVPFAYLGPVFQRISHQVGPDQPELRGSLVTAQMTALVVGRYLVPDPALTGCSQQDLVRIAGRRVQELLTGPLPSGRPEANTGA
jgi:AcrR family transcriptional regulator